MRLYILKETEKAYLLEGVNFPKKWIPKKAVKIIENTKRLGMNGESQEMEIEKWALVINIKNES